MMGACFTLGAAGAALLSTLPGASGDLSKTVRLELRGLITTALCATDPAVRTGAVKAAVRVTDASGAQLDELLDVVRAGPLLTADPDRLETLARDGEELVRYDEVVTGLRFEFDGHEYGYAVSVPSNYSSGDPSAVLLDPGHGSGSDDDQEGKAGLLGMYRRHADTAGFRDWLVVRTEIIEQVGDGGLRGKLPEDQVAPIFDAFFRDLSSRFAVDLDRVHSTGVSQTGFWTWYLGRERADRFAAIEPMAAVTWQIDDHLGNFIALPVFAIHGSADSVCPVGQPRATCAALERLGAPISYRELSDAGHDYSTFKHLPLALEALGDTPRTRYPQAISKSVGTLSSPWCYWLRIDALKQENAGTAKLAPTGGVDAELDGQTIRLFSTGVERLTVVLAPEMLDLAADIEVQWNGETVHAGEVVLSFANALTIAAEKGDWTALFPAQITLHSEP